MLELLVAVSLDPLEQGSESHLLLSAQTALLAVYNDTDCIFLAISLGLFLDVALNIKFFCLFVSF